jgi:hypothetical protein
MQEEMANPPIGRAISPVFGCPDGTGLQRLQGRRSSKKLCSDDVSLDADADVMGEEAFGRTASMQRGYSMPNLGLASSQHSEMVPVDDEDTPSGVPSASPKRRRCVPARSCGNLLDSCGAVSLEAQAAHHVAKQASCA